MGRLASVVVMTVALCGCKKTTNKLPWGPHAHTTVTAGTFQIPIPAGWRDMTELTDAKLRSTIPAQTTSLALEGFDGGRFFPNIMIAWMPMDAVMPCPELVAAVIKMDPTLRTSDVKTIGVGSLMGCVMNVSKNRTVGKQLVAFAPGHWLTLQCLWDAAGEPAAETACTEVMVSLKVNDSPLQTLATDPELKTIGSLVDGRYKILRHLGQNSTHALVAVENVKVPGKPGKTRVLIAPRSDASKDASRVLYNWAAVESAKATPALPIVEFANFATNTARYYVIVDLDPAEIADVLAGRTSLR